MSGGHPSTAVSLGPAPAATITVLACLGDRRARGDGRTYGTIASLACLGDRLRVAIPPNRFVRVYACQPGGAVLKAPPNAGVRRNVRGGQVDAGESPAALAARVRLIGDNSLVGDSFEGRPFCAPLPPN